MTKSKIQNKSKIQMLLRGEASHCEEPKATKQTQKGIASADFVSFAMTVKVSPLARSPRNDRRIYFFTICALSLFWILCFGICDYSFGAGLRVEGEIEIGAGRSLRLEPVVGTMPASAERGDLFFNSGTLYTCPLDTCDEMGDWEVVSERGDLLYDDTTSSLYYRDDTAWRRLGGEGPKTVASRIVAASNSDLSNKTADYFCDGINDQQEINRAINDLGTVGGAVYLLEGTYNISAALLEGETITGVVAHTGTAIIGTGAGTILQIVSGASGVNVINASGVNRVLISQLTINGNNKTGTNNNGIYFNAVTSSKIDKVLVEEVSLYGIFLNSSSNNNIITGNTVWGNNGFGIYFLSSSNNTITGNSVEGNSFGIFLTFASNNTITGNSVGGNTASGIYLVTSSNNNTITGNSVGGNIGEGIYLISSSNNTITGNTVQGSGGNGIFIINTSNNNTITGNTVGGNVWDGIYFDNSNNNIITSNTIYDNGGSGANNGIRISSNSDTNLISSNRIYDSLPATNGGYGINISASTCDNSYIVGNFIDGAGFSAPISDSGTSTKYTDKAKMTLEKRTVTSGFSPLDVATNPRTYVALNPGAAITLTLAAGKAAGDLLILENVSNKLITINQGANLNLVANLDGVVPPNRPKLDQYDTLELIWNGSKWLEIKYVNN